MAEKVLSLLLTQAAAGAVLTILFLATRRILRKHVRPSLFYAAWLLVVLRMLMPAALPNPLLPCAHTPQALPAIQAPAYTVRGPVSEYVPLDAKAAARQTDPLAEIYGSASTAAIMPFAEDGNAAASPRPAILSTPLLLLLLLWGFGCICTLVYMVNTNKRLKKAACLRPVKLPDALWPVYLSDLPSPCVLGALRPVIALTKESLNPENLNWVLLHESCHIRRHDPQWGILRNAICALFWFSPFVWLAARLVRRDCELACDETANRYLGRNERFDYAQTLLRLASKPLPFAVTAMSNTKTDLKERLENIVERKAWKKAAGVFAAILLLTATAASFATTPVSAEQAIPPAATEEPTENLVGFNDFIKQNSKDLLQQKLDDLEKRFGAGHEMASVYMDRTANYDGETYWKPFIQAVDKVNTREEYLVFLKTRFPGINEAFPGDPSIAQVMPRIDGMVRSVLGIDLALPRYESCRSPGNFIIHGSDLNNNVRYEVETQQNEITYFATDYVYPVEIQYPDAAPASEAENDGRLNLAVEMAKDFARHHLAGREEDCDIGYEREDSEDAMVTSPARFYVSFPSTGWRYSVEVDLARMRVVRAELKKAGKKIPSAQDYLKAAWPLDTNHYSDLMINFDDRVDGKQLYLCEGTISAIMESDPQVVIMVLGGGEQPMYVTLSNTDGESWEVGSACRVCAVPIAKYTALPKFALSGGMSDYLPLLMVSYTFKDTENYTANKLIDQLTALESSYGGSSGGLDVYKSRANDFDTNDVYMMDFAQAVMAVDSLASYQTLLNTRFPGINEALPGHTAIDQLRKKYNAMLRIGMQADLSKCYWRYEACLGPGEFDIMLGEGSGQKRYRIHILNDAVTDITTYASREELENQIILPSGQQSADDLNKAATAARDFAVSYLYAGEMECKMSFPDIVLPKGQYPGLKPVQINMAISGTGLGYIITVDLQTMLVTQVIMSEMEVSDGGTVTPKQN